MKWTDTSVVAAGTHTYIYRVRARDAAGNESTKVDADPITVATAATEYAWDEGTQPTYSITGSELTLFVPLTLATFENLDHLTVSRTGGSTFTPDTILTPAGATKYSYADSAVSAGTSYTYTVVAVKADASESVPISVTVVFDAGVFVPRQMRL